MNVYDSLRGVVLAAQQAGAELRRIDPLMHEINSKIMPSPAGHETKAAWQDVYQEWCALALNSPLLREREPRVTSADVRDQLGRGVRLRDRAMTIYSQWRAVYRRPSPDVLAANAVLGALDQPKSKTETVLKYACIAAALLGGAAAAKMLVDSFRPKKTPETPHLPPSLPPGFGQAPSGMMLIPMMPELAPRAEQAYRPMHDSYEENFDE